jgi:hypothetical protein
MLLPSGHEGNSAALLEQAIRHIRGSISTMEKITKTHVLAVLGIVAALAIGYFKVQVRSAETYTDATDPLRLVDHDGYWGLTIQNVGPSTDAVSFWYVPSQNEVYCELQSYFSENERREIENVCDAISSLAEDTITMQIVLTDEMFERSNWRDVFRKENGFQ